MSAADPIHFFNLPTVPFRFFSSEDALKEFLLKFLQSHSQPPPGLARSSCAEFYDKFQSEADEYDRDLMHKHEQDLDTTLIFVGTPFTPYPQWP